MPPLMICKASAEGPQRPLEKGSAILDQAAGHASLGRASSASGARRSARSAEADQPDTQPARGVNEVRFGSGAAADHSP